MTSLSSNTAEISRVIGDYDGKQASAAWMAYAVIPRRHQFQATDRRTDKQKDIAIRI